MKWSIPNRLARLSMVGRLTDCALMSFATPADSVKHLIPDGLELMTRGDRAFWNVVSCRVDHMRPKSLPTAVGVSYHHVAYRLLVQAMTDRAELVQGLYFVRSDADAALLGTVGNRTTDFKFHPAAITLDAAPDRYQAVVTTADGAGDASFELGATAPAAGPRHPQSCFATHLDAHEWLTYRPLGLSVATRRTASRLRLAEVHRDHTAWRETVVQLTGFRSAVFEILNQTPERGLMPEHATRVADMDYEWRLGKTMPLHRPAVAGMVRPATNPSPAGVA